MVSRIVLFDSLNRDEPAIARATHRCIRPSRLDMHLNLLVTPR
jgi:hypothetical protein